MVTTMVRKRSSPKASNSFERERGRESLGPEAPGTGRPGGLPHMAALFCGQDIKNKCGQRSRGFHGWNLPARSSRRACFNSRMTRGLWAISQSSSSSRVSTDSRTFRGISTVAPIVFMMNKLSIQKRMASGLFGQPSRHGGLLSQFWDRKIPLIRSARSLTRNGKRATLASMGSDVG